jgi:hypothetical protein
MIVSEDVCKENEDPVLEISKEDNVFIVVAGCGSDVLSTVASLPNFKYQLNFTRTADDFDRSSEIDRNKTISVNKVNFIFYLFFYFIFSLLVIDDVA